MKKYFDKNGVQVDDGDIVFYNEPISYAESIHVIEKKDNGELFGRTVVGNWSGEYHLVDNDPLTSLDYYCNLFDKNWVMNDAVRIGTVKDNPEMLTVEYATKNYPLPTEPADKQIERMNEQ